MKRLGVLLAGAVVGALAFPGLAGAATPHFSRTSAQTSGDSLEIDFVERGLVPGQNYAYVGSSSKVTETFQCYRTSTFTPLAKTYKVTSFATTPDVRGYTANANGVVKGFVFVENVIGLPDQCPGPDREPVPIHIRYTNYELVDIFTTSFADVTGVFAGPIEPD
jgi:hypothetical protein